MKKFNIYSNPSKDLGSFIDHRGSIHDIFYKTNLNHVAIIESVPNAERGNHYHAKTTQHIYIISGSLEYWYKNGETADPKFEICVKGDLVTSEKNEIHALKISADGCTFIAFTEGIRGGKDFESDTYRTENIIQARRQSN